MREERRWVVEGRKDWVVKKGVLNRGCFNGMNIDADFYNDGNGIERIYF